MKCYRFSGSRKSSKMKKKDKEALLAKKLKRYVSRDLPHTREYLIYNILKNPDFIVSKGFMLKEDFIEEYYKSRIDIGEPIFECYDFSYLPEFITNRKEKVTIFVNEFSTKTGKLIGFWETSYHDLITCKQDNRSISGMYKSKQKTSQYISTELFIEKSKLLFNNTYGYEKTKYVNNVTKVTLRCNICGNYFDIYPYEHLHSAGHGCLSCSMKRVGLSKRKTTEEFISELVAIFGEGFFDYSETVYVDSKTKVIVKDPITGDTYLRYPSTLLGGSDPHCGNSKGELYITSWLKNNETSFDYWKSEVRRKDISGHRGFTREISNGAIIDFELSYKNKIYWIEYDGIQHYKYLPNSFFHKSIDDFNRQVLRDKEVDCVGEKLGIQVIRIPYTYKEKEEVWDLLNNIIFLGKQGIINYPEKFKL